MTKSKHSTPATSHTRINGHADTNRMVHQGGDYVLVIDAEMRYYWAAEDMTEAIAWGKDLGADLGAYVQVTVPAGISPSDYAHTIGY